MNEYEVIKVGFLVALVWDFLLERSVLLSNNKRSDILSVMNRLFVLQSFWVLVMLSYQNKYDAVITAIFLICLVESVLKFREGQLFTDTVSALKSPLVLISHAILAAVIYIYLFYLQSI